MEYKETKKQPIRTTKEKNEKNEDSVRSLWDNFKYTNIHIMGVPKGEESKKLETYLKKVKTENFPNLGKEINIQVQEAQRVPNMMNRKRPTHHN